MKILKRHVHYFLIAAMLFELFFGLGLLVTDSVNTIEAIDTGVMASIVDIRTAEASSMMKWVTSLGDYEFVLHVTVIIGLLMAVFGHIEISLGIISGIALTNYLTGMMKQFFRILRPEDFIMHVGGWSYPSGHVSGSAILAFMIIWAACVAIPKKYRILKVIVIFVALLYAGGVAISRMYLGVHWLSDVVGGILLAASVGVLMMGILKPVIMKRKQTC